MELNKQVKAFLDRNTETKTFKKTDYDTLDYSWYETERTISRYNAECAIEMAISLQWNDIKECPLEQFVEVLAFNKEWIDEDKCPNGIRIGFLGEDGFISATWNMEHDCYDTVYEEGDDYYKGNAYIIEEEKKKALPNMPTHYMMIPNCKAQKGE